MKNETLTAILNEKDKLSAYMGVGVDYYKGETGKSGADEVYIGPEPPTDPQVKLWVDTEAQSVGVVDWNDVGNKPNFATVATSGSYEDLTNKPNLFDGDYNNLTNKPTIPEPYTLPTASTTTLGGVKVDGETITIADGVISSAGGGGSINAYKFSSNTTLTTEEKNQLIDCAKNREKVLLINGELVVCVKIIYSTTDKKSIGSIYFSTITNNDTISVGSNVTYEETNKYNYYQFNNLNPSPKITKRTPYKDEVLLEVKNIDWPLNKQDIKNGMYNWMIDWASGKEYLVWVNNYLVYATNKYSNYLSLSLMGNDYGGDTFNVANINIYFTDTSFTKLDSTKTYSGFAGNTLLTSNNWNQYISVSGGSDWSVTTSTSESNLYNAKEVVIFWQDSNYNRHQSYLNVGCDYWGNSGQTWGSSNWINTQIRLDSYDNYNGSSITYDGSNVNASDCTIDAICYKT